MSAGDRRLRAATLASPAVCICVLAALTVTFRSLPVNEGECGEGPGPGVYRDVLIPLHLVAFVAIGGAVAALDAVRRDGRPARRTLVALGGAAVFVLASLVWHPLMTIPALVAMVVAGPLLLGLIVALAIVAVLERRAREGRWARRARQAQLVAWACLLVGLPASYGYAWTDASEWFCF